MGTRRYAVIIGGLLLGGQAGHLAGEGDEVFVLGDEVRFTVHLQLDHGRATRIGSLHDHPLGCRAGSLFFRLGLAGFTYQFDCLLDVSIRLRERFFALHHAQSGAVPHFLDQCRRYRHAVFPVIP